MSRATLLILAALLTLSSCGTPAFAAKRHVRHHTHHVRPAGAPVLESFWSHFQGGDLVQTARAEIGNGAVYGRRNLWCARFLNAMLAKTGHKGTGSDLARSFASMPHTTLHVGAIAVMSRRGGGHVGVVSGVAASGDPIVISGNNGNRVREAIYPRSRIVAFVSPQ